jgi:hypothetical protein
MPRREALPDDLKKLCSLCRAGKLFAVQEWIKTGRRFQMPAGNFSTSPLRMSIGRGFHSLVEVLLQAGISQDEKDDALALAVSERDVDLVELLAQYGADVRSIETDEVFWSRSPQIIRWFLDHEMDLETNQAIAKAFRDKQREFLGIYMGLRDRVPSARKQAAMALRHHAEDGNLKWVSLLLWAGADPRLRVLHIDDRGWDEPDEETALNAAILYGRVEIVEKMEVKPERDNVTALLDQHFIYPKPELIELLLSKGADMAHVSQPIESVISSFCWSQDPTFSLNPTRAEEALRCMELLGANGLRWAPTDGWRITRLRKTLSRISSYRADSNNSFPRACPLLY